MILINQDNSNIQSMTIENVVPFPNNGIKFKFGQKQKTDKANIHILVGKNGSGKSALLKTLFYLSYKNKDSLHTTNNNNYFDQLKGCTDSSLLQLEKWQNVFFYTPNEFHQTETNLNYTNK